MSSVYLLLGSNFAEKELFLKTAYEKIINQVGKLVSASSIYETEPWGFEANESFLNQVIHISSNMSAREIMLRCQEIEESLGRIRSSSGYESRSIDIDMLFYDNMLIQEPDLEVPHPRLHQRKFVLVPMNEIAAELIHPALNKTIGELLEDCPDKGWIKRWS